jgi:hypothetical protein
MTTYRSIFGGITAAEREENFRTCFEFSCRQSGDLLEAEQPSRT